MKAGLVDVAGAVFLLAIALVLVRPSSQAPAFVRAIGEGVSGLVSFAVTG